MKVNLKWYKRGEIGNLCPDENHKFKEEFKEIECLKIRILYKPNVSSKYLKG